MQLKVDHGDFCFIFLSSKLRPCYIFFRIRYMKIVKKKKNTPLLSHHFSFHVVRRMLQRYSTFATHLTSLAQNHSKQFLM